MHCKLMNETLTVTEPTARGVPCQTVNDMDTCKFPGILVARHL